MTNKDHMMDQFLELSKAAGSASRAVKTIMAEAASGAASATAKAVARHQAAQKASRTHSLEDLANGSHIKARPQPLVRDDLRYQIGGVSKALYELARHRHQGVRSSEKHMDSSLKGLRKFQRELYGRLYNPNAKAIEETPEDLVQEVADHIHKALDELPAFRRLQDACHGQNTLSAVSTIDLATGVIDDILERWKESADDKQQDSISDPGQKDLTEEQAMQMAIEDWCDAQEDDDGAKAALRSVVGQAVEEAQDTADEVASAIGAGFGLEDATETRQMDQDLALQLAGAMAASSRFRTIVELLGRFRDTFKTVKATKYSDGQQTPYSVAPGDDLRTLLPMERSALANPLTQMATMHRLQLRQTLCYKVRSKQPKEMGPFWILLDCSGSMGKRGEAGPFSRMEMAAAFCLAALQQAAEEGRDVGLISFGGSSATLHSIDLTTRQGKLKALHEVANITHGGGTPIHKAMVEAWIQLSDGDGDADVMLLTDGDVMVDQKRLDDMTEVGELHYIKIGQKDSVYGGDQRLKEASAQVVIASDLFDNQASDFAVRATTRAGQ